MGLEILYSSVPEESLGKKLPGVYLLLPGSAFYFGWFLWSYLPDCIWKLACFMRLP